MAKRTKTGSTALSNQDEIPTVRPPQSGWRKQTGPSVPSHRPGQADGLWQLVCDLMRAEADEALWGTRR